MGSLLRRATRAGFAGLGLLASWGCAASSTQGRASASPWLELQTPHFQVVTNLPDPSARDLAQSLEEARAALLLLAWGGAEGPSGRSEVLVFARQSEFEMFRGDAQAVGELASYPGFPRLLVFTPGRDAGLSRIAVHELAHELGFWFVPLQPIWFREGLASVLEGLTFDRSASRARLGQSTEDRMGWLKRTRTITSSQALFRAARATHLDARRSASFYSSAWLLTQYLLNRHNAAFGRFQLQLARLRAWEDAWAVEFPELYPEYLDSELMKYATQAEFSVREAQVSVPAFEASLRPLSRAEQQGTLARAALLMGNYVLAKKLRFEAQRLDPTEVAAAEVESYEPAAAAGDRERYADRRAELAARVARAHPESARSWLLLAQADPSDAVRARALERARALDPHHPNLHWLLAWQALDRRQPEAALDHAHFVLRRWPLTPDVIRLEVVALAANGGCDIANQIVQTAHGIYAACETVTAGKSSGCLTELRQMRDQVCPGAPSKNTHRPDIFIKPKPRR